MGLLNALFEAQNHGIRLQQACISGNITDEDIVTAQKAFLAVLNAGCCTLKTHREDNSPRTGDEPADSIRVYPFMAIPAVAPAFSAQPRLVPGLQSYTIVPSQELYGASPQHCCPDPHSLSPSIRDGAMRATARMASSFLDTTPLCKTTHQLPADLKSHSSSPKLQHLVDTPAACSHESSDSGSSEESQRKRARSCSVSDSSSQSFKSPRVRPKWTSFNRTSWTLTTTMPSELYKMWYEGTETTPSVAWMDSHYGCREHWVYDIPGLKQKLNKRAKILERIERATNAGHELSSVLEYADRLREDAGTLIGFEVLCRSPQVFFPSSNAAH